MKYRVKDLANIVLEYENFEEAEKKFNEFPNTTEIVEKNGNGNENVLKSRTHKEVGMIEINNKCVYLKVPFFEPSDRPEIKTSKIGETPEMLRNKMDVIDEKWNNNN